jgi:ribosomal protein S13
MDTRYSVSQSELVNFIVDWASSIWIIVAGGTMKINAPRKVWASFDHFYNLAERHAKTVLLTYPASVLKSPSGAAKELVETMKNMRKIRKLIKKKVTAKGKSKDKEQAALSKGRKASGPRETKRRQNRGTQRTRTVARKARKPRRAAR